MYRFNPTPWDGQVWQPICTKTSKNMLSKINSMLIIFMERYVLGHDPCLKLDWMPQQLIFNGFKNCHYCRICRKEINNVMTRFIPIWNKHRKKNASIKKTLKAVCDDPIGRKHFKYDTLIDCLETSKNLPFKLDKYFWLDGPWRSTQDYHKGQRYTNALRSEIENITQMISTLNQKQIELTIISLPNVAKWVNLLCYELKPSSENYIIFILHFILHIFTPKTQHKTMKRPLETTK